MRFGDEFQLSQSTEPWCTTITFNCNEDDLVGLCSDSIRFEEARMRQQQQYCFSADLARNPRLASVLSAENVTRMDPRSSIKQLNDLATVHSHRRNFKPNPEDQGWSFCQQSSFRGSMQNSTLRRASRAEVRFCLLWR